MKTYQHLQFSGIKFSLRSSAMGLPIVVSIFFATSLAGQLATPPQGDNAAPAIKEKILLKKVMTDLPHYGDVPAVVSVAKPEPVAEATPEVVHLVPFVVVGAKVPKLTEPELLTKKAFASGILKQYDYSAFSMFQHKEDVRLQDMETLKNYADSLMLFGDVNGSREIKDESDRLFLRRHDPESEYIDTLLNSRIR